MTNNLSETLLARLKIPEQTLDKLSFCKSSTVRHVQQWLDALPVTQTTFIATVLCSALPEFVQLKVAPHIRAQILEVVRPVVQDCITRLSLEFLHQPLELPEPALKAATAAQILQKYLGNAYLIVVRDLIQTGKHQNLLPLAIHRALSCHSLFIWRGYLLYVPIAPQIWLETHTLYQLAENLDIHTQPVADSTPYYGHMKTIEQAYLRVVLLSAAQPNHLRQQELIDTYHALEMLAPYAKIEPCNRDYKHNLHAIMLYSFEPPLYQSRLPSNYHDEKRTINTSKMIGHLNDKNFTMSIHHERTSGLTPSLKASLEAVWKTQGIRKHERQRSKGNIEVVIGLSSIHFYSANMQLFKDFLQQGHAQEQSEMLVTEGFPETQQTSERPSFDPSNVDFGPGLAIASSASTQALNPHQALYPIYNAAIADHSSDGYYLRWLNNTPNKLAPGEIIGVRKQGQALWAIGIIIWIRHARGITHSGVKILANSAQPTAVIPKTSLKRDYLRALKLPRSIITNSVGFHEFDQVALYQASGEATAQLSKRLLSTSVISQFAFRESSRESEDDQEN